MAVFIRYQSPEPDRHGLHVGVFGLANQLGRGGRLSADEHRIWRNGNDWFNAAYPTPDARVYDRGINPGAVAWFKDTATHLLERIPPYLELLAAHGVACVRVESCDPGRVVYEDDVQIVVVPHPAA